MKRTFHTFSSRFRILYPLLLRRYCFYLGTVVCAVFLLSCENKSTTPPDTGPVVWAFASEYSADLIPENPSPGVPFTIRLIYTPRYSGTGYMDILAHNLDPDSIFILSPVSDTLGVPHEDDSSYGGRHNRKYSGREFTAGVTDTLEWKLRIDRVTRPDRKYTVTTTVAFDSIRDGDTLLFIRAYQDAYMNDTGLSQGLGKEFKVHIK